MFFSVSDNGPVIPVFHATFFWRCVYKKRFCKTKTCFFKRTCGKLRTPCCVPTKQLMLKHQPTFNSANVTFFEMVKTVSDRERQKKRVFLQKSGIKFFRHGLKQLECVEILTKRNSTNIMRILRDATPKQIAGLLRDFLTTNVP